MPKQIKPARKGTKINMLTLTDTFRNDQNRLQAVLSCDCGKTGHVIGYSHWVNGSRKSCGCVRKGPSEKREKEFPIGDKFGSLTLKSVEYRMIGDRNKSMATVDCDCGVTDHVCQWNHMKNGRIKSCGCKMGKYTHGGSGTITHERWRSMRSRVRSDVDQTRIYYKDRGITVCDRWDNVEDGFVNFLEDMGECPEGYELDRIDPDGNYEPGNCRWATKSMQVRNRRYKREKSPYRNVFPYGRLGWKYGAMIGGERIQSNLTFTTPEDAAKAYNRLAVLIGLDPIKDIGECNV